MVYCDQIIRPGRQLCSIAVANMEALIFIGIQASGKSTFYKQRFSATHVHVNLDTLKTRRREDVLLQDCFDAKRQFVVDNTNVTQALRTKYIAGARKSGFRVVGYYFESKIADGLRRNALRPPDQCVPEKGLLGTYAKLEIPSLSEGFDELQYVRIGLNNVFVVEDWRDEI